MLSTNKVFASILVAAIGILVAGCGQSETATTGPSVQDRASSAHVTTDDPQQVRGLPRIASVGSRLHSYASLTEIADVSIALVVGIPTGKQSSVPLPREVGGTADSAPTTYVEMRINKVLSGDLRSKTIDVVSPGTDENTGRPALLSGGPFLMYLTPAMYDVNAPAGGFAITGGPAGVYGFDGASDEFSRIDGLSTELPSRIDLNRSSPPKAKRSRAELLDLGPR